MDNKIPYSKTHFKVVMCLYQNGRDTIMKAYTINTIAETIGISKNTVRKAVTIFIELGYVAEGSPDGQSKTYYITNEGKEIHKQYIGE